jgi:hypothetical protein
MTDVGESIAIGTLMARYTATGSLEQRGWLRYVLIPLTSHVDLGQQHVLTMCVDGYSGYRRPQPFIGKSSVSDDALWEQLCRT